MPASSTKIDYTIRPAKHVERKMIAEALQRLAEFGSLESYRYIGFGAAYFRDFSLFHRQLGLTNMIDVEADTDHEERYRFNRPFSCIDIHFGWSSEVLPKLPWNMRSILWLDYDYALNASVLDDVRLFVSNPYPGSVLLVTLDARSNPTEEESLDNLKLELGPGKVPADVKRKDLDGWGTARLYRRILTNEIAATLADVNGPRPVGSKFVYKQLFNFHYADSAPMLTVGGLLYDEGQEAKVQNCSFESLPFIKSDAEEYRIEIPRLTYREIHHLDRQLPCDNWDDLDMPGVPPEDAKKYAKIYRYFPTFAETTF
jgi:hypothetical protein